MNKQFKELLEIRRSRYGISNERVVEDEVVIELVSNALLHTPTAFNSQSSRAIILFEEKHDDLWTLIIDKIALNISGDALEKSKEKIATFAAGVGTILFFEETKITKDLQTRFPLYAKNFEIWANQSNGMLQNNIWLGLSLEGYGASLQHYSELISEDIKKQYNLPSTFQLIAQMPFGKPITPPGEKEFVPLDQRLSVYR